jgi:hypothetical protein
MSAYSPYQAKDVPDQPPRSRMGVILSGHTSLSIDYNEAGVKTAVVMADLEDHM